MLVFSAVQTFVVLAETLNFSKAAERLYISQPAVSKQIRALEVELGTELLERDRHRVVLTEAGKKCLPAMRRILENCEEVTRTAEEYRGQVCGELRIAYPNIAGLMMLGPVMRRLEEKYPGLRMKMEQIPALDSMEAFEKGGVDCVIALAQSLSRFDNIGTHVLKEGHMVAVLPPDHPLAGRKEIRYGDLGAEEVLIHRMDRKQAELTGMEADLLAHGIRGDAIRQMGRTEDIFAAVAIHHGAGIMPDGLFCYSMDPLVSVPIVDSQLKNDVVIAWRRDEKRPVIRAFVSELDAQAAPER